MDGGIAVLVDFDGPCVGIVDEGWSSTTAQVHVLLAMRDGKLAIGVGGNDGEHKDVLGLNLYLVAV